MDLDSLKQTILDIESRAISNFDTVNNKSELDDSYRSFLGKKGEVNLLLKSLGSLPQEKRKEAGKILNQLKSALDSSYAKKTISISAQEKQDKLNQQKIDVTLDGFEDLKGSVHPVTQTINDICDFFERMGFDIESGPEAEIDYYNFEALNVPDDHPAKDMHDTFYLDNKGLLRTHTSPVQIRTMEKAKAPHRIICPGKVYRKDSDLTHTPMFHQIEGLVVEEGASFSQLKGLLNDFLEDFFGEEVELRFRPSYFPFTEPSAEADIRWKKNWLEVLGCGMVHPNVLKGVGVDTKKYSGFAFGLGVERMAMLKYDIPDLRAFFDNDIRFLNQF
jgi:phenylalanyl-tRNA synthetase alpha chain